jgi:hypothetical protein
VNAAASIYDTTFICTSPMNSFLYGGVSGDIILVQVVFLWNGPFSQGMCRVCKYKMSILSMINKRIERFESRMYDF